MKKTSSYHSSSSFSTSQGMPPPSSQGGKNLLHQAGGGGERDRGGDTDHTPANSANIGIRGRARLMNDYNQHFVDVGERPQNFIRDYEEEKRFQEYPKLEKLMKLKRQVLERRNTPSLCVQGDLRNFDWHIFEGVKFDVILVDPPWQEYHDRCAAALGATNEDLAFWTLEDLAKLPVDMIGETPSFCFLWCGVTHLEDARVLLNKVC
ncbi:n6-adenosine-methyltransferase [Cystoisospora suis]|uniref:N6-adenosine-methyltransferase n=1 Tax=Cystoisospora suis TaxID=483139 RepID=A0A2C6JVJ5_9APIC|nr:n6-adenosine-methyltransferase [Cystoisospora suis]